MSPPRLEHHGKVNAVSLGAKFGLRTRETARGEEASGTVLVIAALHCFETRTDVGHFGR